MFFEQCNVFEFEVKSKNNEIIEMWISIMKFQKWNSFQYEIKI